MSDTNAKDIWSVPDFAQGMPGFNQQAAYGADPYQQAKYQDPTQSMQDIQGMYADAGITGPGDQYGAMKGAYMADMTSALNAAGASGMRGGTQVANNQDALRRSGGLQGLAGLAGQQAQAQTQWDQMLGSQALGYGAGRSAFGQGEQQFGANINQQDRQFGTEFDANQALQAYQLNQLDPWTYDQMVRMNADSDQAQRMAAGDPVLQEQYQVFK